jgi:predicted transcriptional regulator
MLSPCPIDLKENAMSTAIESVREVLEYQPDDARSQKIMQELAFDRMVAKGLEHVRTGRVIDNQEIQKRIRQWSVAQKKSRTGLP